MPLEDALQEIEGVRVECGSEDWDGYGAAHISGESYFESIRFLKLIPKNIPYPSMGAEPDGQITLEWYKDRRCCFSVSVGKEKLAYAGLFGQESEHGEVPFRDEIPKVILDLISRVYN